jgi:hypothetical protein
LADPARRFFVDEMPFNELYFPLLRMAFPRAPIIRVVRYPLVCVSMMAHLSAIFELTEHCTARARAAGARGALRESRRRSGAGLSADAVVAGRLQTATARQDRTRPATRTRLREPESKPARAINDVVS